MFMLKIDHKLLGWLILVLGFGNCSMAAPAPPAQPTNAVSCQGDVPLLVETPDPTVTPPPPPHPPDDKDTKDTKDSGKRTPKKQENAPPKATTKAAANLGSTAPCNPSPN